MPLVNPVAELRDATATFGRAGKAIGFVPTMGFLHIGHLERIVQMPDLGAEKVAGLVEIKDAALNQKRCQRGTYFQRFGESLCNLFLFRGKGRVMYPALFNHRAKIIGFRNACCQNVQSDDRSGKANRKVLSLQTINIF